MTPGEDGGCLSDIIVMRKGRNRLRCSTDMDTWRTVEEGKAKDKMPKDCGVRKETWWMEIME